MESRTIKSGSPWCAGGPHLVELLRDAFGAPAVNACSPHHIQVKRDGKTHNVWIDSANGVKFCLAGQTGRAQQASSAASLLDAIRGFQLAESDLTAMRRALELSELITSAKAALPTSGLDCAVFVDAGIKDKRAQISAVRVSFDKDGEHVRAESHPIEAANSTDAEQAAIEFALTWAQPSDVIFCDNQVAVNRARREYGDRVRWLPREQNRAADRVANLRGSKSKRKRRKTKKAPDES
ncbi:MAG: hypothetical protein KDB22_11865 [Planctomycetales bacterium]|nr:hypothetical protein [Planctomycetales bacterium]